MQALTTYTEVSLSRLRRKLSIPFIHCPRSTRQPLRKTRLYIYKIKDYEAIRLLQSDPIGILVYERLRFTLRSGVCMHDAAVADVCYSRQRPAAKC